MAANICLLQQGAYVNNLQIPIGLSKMPVLKYEKLHYNICSSLVRPLQIKMIDNR